MSVILEHQGMACQFKFSEKELKDQHLGMPKTSKAWHASFEATLGRATWGPGVARQHHYSKDKQTGHAT
ncbi:hypothetical protein AHAS_Ahas05G0052600 [Arachis hypogaea]